MTDTLNPKEQQFVREYLVDLNAAKAAVRAGYSRKTAKEYACALMKRPRIKAAIEAAMAERTERVHVDQDYVIRKLHAIVERCTTSETWDAAGANRALEMLGKHMAMFTDKHAFNIDPALVQLITKVQDLPEDALLAQLERLRHEQGALPTAH